MPLGITWCGVEEASAKYSLSKSLILQWVEEGVIRAEQFDKRVVRVHVDDIELMVQEMTGF